MFLAFETARDGCLRKSLRRRTKDCLQIDLYKCFLLATV